jgi:hypothetical protein
LFHIRNLYVKQPHKPEPRIKKEKATLPDFSEVYNGIVFPFFDLDKYQREIDRDIQFIQKRSNNKKEQIMA